MNIIKHEIDDCWALLAAMLREELEAYGKLFSILESQRGSLLEQDIDAIIGANGALQQQAELIHQIRDRRLEFIQSCSEAIAFEGSEPATVKGLVRSAPEKYSAMFDGLIKEVERLVTATRNYLKRNQMLMRRAYDMNRQFLSLVNADGTQTVAYRRNGALENPRSHALASTYIARA
jgi:flagellar biosynthesis/type III secretory pathway chaperone